MNFDPIRPYLSALKLAAFLACVIAAFSYGCSRGQASGERKVRASEVAAANARAKAAEDNAKAVQAQAERYKTRAESQAAIAQQYQQELSNAHDRADRTVADLRSGNVKLRHQWQRCLGQVPATGQTPSDPGEPDDGAGLRTDDLGRVREIAAQCTLHARALLKVAQDDRQ